MNLLQKLSQKFMIISSPEEDSIFYVGGSDTLPPTLSRDEENELLERLKAYSQEMKEQVEAKAAKLDEVGYKEYMK